MAKGSKFVVPPVAGYALYRAYQQGAFDGIKKKIFKGAESLLSTNNSEEINVITNLGATSSGAIDIEQACTIQGQSAENVTFDPEVYQYYDDTCAIQSQRIILQQFGIDVSQEELIAIAKEHGWYAEGYGTPMNMVGKLLEYYNIDITASQGNNIFNLSNELAQGHQIIVGVDANELVHPEGSFVEDLIYGERANHALVVVGVDTTDPSNVQVIVTDPGTGNRQMAYPAEQFIDAWKDSNCFMVSTNDLPISNPLHGFSPIESFAGISVETLDRLAGMDINTDNELLYSNFVDDFMDNPTAIDELISNYQELFVPEPEMTDFYYE
ncbi:MAG: C39 family peptidase [Paludibacteraceae bacterium]|nr:C39 family peptidase [Paludibacteraceae bacterium]